VAQDVKRPSQLMGVLRNAISIWIFFILKVESFLSMFVF
jgi:hypothetical protein